MTLGTIIVLVGFLFLFGGAGGIQAGPGLQLDSLAVALVGLVLLIAGTRMFNIAHRAESAERPSGFNKRMREGAALAENYDTLPAIDPQLPVPSTRTRAS